MEHREPWEADHSSASQEIPHLLYNLQSTHPLSLKSILILFFHLSLGFSAGLFSGSPTKVMCEFLSLQGPLISVHIIDNKEKNTFYEVLLRFFGQL
jgi:hypothetical protein